MYSPFFKLKTNPFGETPNTDFFFKSSSHRKALWDLCWMLSQGKGFALLDGDVGCGKTLLCRVLIKTLGQKAETALILQPILEPNELLDAIAEDFGLKLPNFPDLRFKNKLDALNNFFLETARKGKKTILVIDDAQSLSEQTLEIIRILSNFETENQKLLQIILVGQAEISQKLSQHSLRQLAQRISIRTSLAALSLRETEKYLKHRIQVAGGENFLRFHPKAVRYIHELSGGVPRLINKFCEICLMKAESHQKRLIKINLAKEATKNIGLVKIQKGPKFWSKERHRSAYS